MFFNPHSVMDTEHDLEKTVFVLKCPKTRSTFSEQTTYLSCSFAPPHAVLCQNIWKMCKLKNADVVPSCSCETAGNRAILIDVVVEIMLMLNQ